ncbi:MAG: SPOCS domain-containing protein [Intestinibacillus sp.]
MELIRNAIQFYDLTLDRTSVYEESTDAIVPDAYPDIARIVCATGNAVIKDESPQNDRVLISGTVKTSVLYQPEGEERFRELTVPLNFAHIEEGKGLTPDSVCFVRCQVMSVDARAVNSRKVGVTARLCFETSTYDKREMELTEDVSGGDMPLEILHETNKVCLPVCVQSRDFTILDDLELPGGGGQKLVNAQCALRLNDCRAMHGKAVVKGDAVLHSLILQPEGIKTMEHTIPFTQILEMDGVDEGQPLRVRFAVKNLDCELHDAGILSVGIGASALLCGDQERELRTIRDLYQTTRPLRVQAQPVRVAGIRPEGALIANAEETMPLGMQMAKVVDASAVCHGVQQEDAETLRVTMCVRLLFTADDDELYSASRTLTVPIKLGQPGENLSAQDISLSVAATPNGDGAALRIGVNGNLLRRTECMVNDISAVEAGEPATDDGMGAVTLVLRYVGDAEPLWDIAKSYRTTMQAIRGANSLPADAASAHDQMLLIPICEK